MSKLRKSSYVPTRASWLMIAALAGCAGPTGTESEEGAGDAPTALPLDPVIAEGSVNPEDYVGVATRDSAGKEDPTRDIEGLTFGNYRHWLGWVGSTSGPYSGRLVGGNAVIDAVQVRDGNYVYAIRFHYYIPTSPDNIWSEGDESYWTSWVGPTNRGTLRQTYWCPENTGLTGHLTFLGDSNSRISALMFQCNYVYMENGTPSNSPSYGGGNGLRWWWPACEWDELITDFTLRSDSSSLRGIEGICQSKW